MLLAVCADLGTEGVTVCDRVVMEIELADAVAALRDELLDAAGRATRPGVDFVVGPIELEFGVELKADVKAKSGFKAWVISADAEGGASRARTHRVKITLTAQDEQGQDLQIHSGTGRVFGEAAAVDRVDG